MINIIRDVNKRYDAETAPTYLSRRRFGAAAALAAAGAAFAGALAQGEANAAEQVPMPEYDALVKKITAGRTLKVGFTPPILSEFFDEMEHACWRKAAEYTERFGIRWRWERAAPAGNFNAIQEQVSIIQNWVTAGFDAIMVCTAGDFQAMQKIFAEARSKGVMVVQFNMPMELWPLEEVQSDSAVGYNNILQSGFLAGSFIAKTLGGSGKLLQIWGPSGHWAEARDRGLKLALKTYPGIELVGKADGGYVRDKGFAAAQNLLTAHPDVNAIYGENEEMALGASLALSTAGIAPWNGKTGVLTIGADGLRSGFKAIREGNLTATIDVASVNQGLELIRIVFAHRVIGSSVSRNLEQPTTVVTKDNVDMADAYVAWALGAAKV
jgi:ABC-type sugar transport system substrate-binding protein